MKPTLSLSSAPKLYRPRRPERAPFYAVLHQFFDRFTREYEHRFERTFGSLRGIVPNTVERFFECGLPEGGFARVRCDVCGNEYLVASSCKQRVALQGCGNLPRDGKGMGLDLFGRHLIDPEKITVKIVQAVGNDDLRREALDNTIHHARGAVNPKFL